MHGSSSSIWHLSWFLNHGRPYSSSLLTAQCLAHLVPLWFISYSSLFLLSHLYPTSLNHQHLCLSSALSLFYQHHLPSLLFSDFSHCLPLYHPLVLRVPPYQTSEAYPANTCTVQLFLQVTPSGLRLEAGKAKTEQAWSPAPTSKGMSFPDAWVSTRGSLCHHRATHSSILG